MNDESRKTKTIAVLVAAAVLLVAVCVGVSLLTSRLLVPDTQWKHDLPHGHAWLHEELGLTEEEAGAVDAFEGDYRALRGELLETFRTRIAELREIIAANDQFTPEVRHAIHRLHDVHGELQELSIRHYYDMMRVLPPDKQAKLRCIATEALSEPE